MFPSSAGVVCLVAFPGRFHHVWSSGRGDPGSGDAMSGSHGTHLQDSQKGILTPGIICMYKGFHLTRG